MENSFTLTKNIIESLQALDNNFAQAFVSLKRSSDQELEAIHRYARVGTIGSSTRIGLTLNERVKSAILISTPCLC